MRSTTRAVFAATPLTSTCLRAPQESRHAAAARHPPHGMPFTETVRAPKSSLRSKVAYGSKEAAAGIRLRRSDAARTDSGGYFAAAKRGLSRKAPRRYRFQGVASRLRPRPPLLVLVAASLGFRLPPEGQLGSALKIQLFEERSGLFCSQNRYPPPSSSRTLEIASAKIKMIAFPPDSSMMMLMR